MKGIEKVTNPDLKPATRAGLVGASLDFAKADEQQERLNRWLELSGDNRETDKLVEIVGDDGRVDIALCQVTGQLLAGLAFEPGQLYSRGLVFSKADLSGLSAQGSDFSISLSVEGNLKRANLRGSDFRDSVHTKGDFTNSDLRDCDMANATFTGTDFGGAKIRGADWTGARLLGVRGISPSDLASSSFKGARIQPITLDESRQILLPDDSELRNKILPERLADDLESIEEMNEPSRLAVARYVLDLTGVDISGQILTGLGWQLDGARANEINIKGSVLTGAEATGAVFDECSARGANLTGMQAAGTSWRGAQLQSANMREMWLPGADMRKANLQGAEIISISAPGAVFDGAIINTEVLSSSVLTGASFEGVSLTPSQASALEGRNIANERAILDRSLRAGQKGELES